MKTLLATTAIVLATATGAFAASSALDVAPIYPVVDNAQAIDFAPTASIGGVELETRGNLGDGSPQYDYSASVTADKSKAAAGTPAAALSLIPWKQHPSARRARLRSW